MTNARLGSDDFIIAARSDGPLRNPDEHIRREPASHEDRTSEAAANILPHLNDDQRREKLTTRALVQENARMALKHLKRAKEREAKFYVNVALSYDLKSRLKRAAHDNDINMTIIMQTAIESYLNDNGY